MDVIYMPYSSQEGSHVSSSCTQTASTRSTPVRIEETGNFVLHEPQLDALKALSEWTDDFDKLSLHPHDGKNNNDDEDQEAGKEEAVEETTTDFSDASST
eukprot:1741355-Pleurochrysis_carterae.AAC.1